MPHRSCTWVLAPALALVVAGCGNWPTTGGDVPAPPPVRAVAAEFAASTTTPGPGVDSSPAAREAFTRTWQYEVVVASDAEGGERGVQKAYDGGVRVCNTLDDRDVNPAELAYGIQQTYGYTPSGGEAVVAAALRTLCPAHDLGYKSGWDRTVTSARNEIEREWGALPTELSTGLATKHVCAYLKSRYPAADDLVAEMTARGMPQNELGQYVPVKLTVRAAVHAHCPHFALGGFWNG